MQQSLPPTNKSSAHVTLVCCVLSPETFQALLHAPMKKRSHTYPILPERCCTSKSCYCCTSTSSHCCTSTSSHCCTSMSCHCCTSMSSYCCTSMSSHCCHSWTVSVQRKLFLQCHPQRVTLASGQIWFKEIASCLAEMAVELIRTSTVFVSNYVLHRLSNAASSNYAAMN